MKTKEQCIELITRTSALDDITEKDIDELIEIVSPFLEKRYGKNIQIQIEKLCRANNFERAVKLLSTLPNRAFLFSGKRSMMSMMIIIAAIGIFAAVFIEQTSDTESSNESAQSYWESTDAVIITSRIGSRINSEGTAAEDFPLIEFRYSVNDITYVSDSVIYTGFDDPGDIIEQYPEGERININYNSDDPQKAFFSVENEMISYFLIFTSILSVFIFLYFFGKRKQRARNMAV